MLYFLIIMSFINLSLGLADENWSAALGWGGSAMGWFSCLIEKKIGDLKCQ